MTARALAATPRERSQASRCRASPTGMHDEEAAVHLFRVVGRARFPDSRRERDPRAGAGRLPRRRAGPAARSGLPPGAPAREARPHRDRDRGVAGLRPRGRSRAHAQVFGDLRGRKVLLVGAGQMGQLAAASLSLAAPRSSTSPTAASGRATELAARFGASGLTARRASPRALAEVDVVRLPRRAQPGLVIATRGRARPAGATRSSSSTSRSRATSTRRSTSSTAASSTTSTTSRPWSPRRSPAAASRPCGPRQLVVRGGRALPRLAGLARGRARDHLPARAGRGDPHRRAREAAGRLSA